MSTRKSGNPVLPRAGEREQRDADQKARAAWLYYMEGMTQDKVAEKLEISRLRVLKLLAASRQDGTVQIRVMSRLQECVQLERQVEQTFGLQQAIVVPTPAEEERLPALIGSAAGNYLSDTLRSSMSVGLGWGQTLRHCLTSIPQQHIDGLTIVSLLGGLTRAAGVNPSEFAWRVADRLEADCYMMTAPVLAPDEETQQALMSHPGIQEVTTHACTLDLALVSVGELAPGSTLMRLGLVTRDDLVSLARAGAVADVLCRFIDRDGRVVDHPLNRRVVAVDPRQLRGTPKLVLASGGWRKLDALRAAIALLSPTVLITDQQAAEGLLAQRSAAAPDGVAELPVSPAR